jgi:pSer/pThr/pTyr-binding forkhead associated (FHA) protein
MQVVLVMFRPGHERRSFSLPRQTTVIGRKEDCDLRIPLAEVSRKHCRFVVEGESLRLEDLGSSNGTYVNGKRIQEAIIKPGDNVQIGPLTFVVQIDGQPPDEEIPEPVAFDLADSGVAAAAGEAAAGDSAFDLDLDLLEEEPKKQTQE